MSWRFLEHTADVGCELAAPDRDALYAEALAAFTDTITPRDGVEPRLSRHLELTARDAESLLVDWLGELLYVFETENLLCHHAEVRVTDAADGLALAAEVHGEPYDPERHPVKVLVKGVTWHQLHAAPRADGSWTARVIFDI
ncbi:MAG TPA: archease [Thermoanaerobaculia bacterium]|nr:archease [Thermoanaerobaculia bacterium]